MKAIKLNDETIDFDKMKMETFSVIKANEEMDKPYTKEEVHSILNRMYSSMYDMVKSVHNNLHARINNAVDQTNECMANHSEKHMPETDKSQVKAILSVAGILDQYSDMKTPIAAPAGYIYASEADAKTTLKDLKFEIK